MPQLGSHLKFGGYEHGGRANELQHLPVDRGFSQVVVRHLYRQVEGLMVQLEILLNKGRNKVSLRASK